MNVTEVAEYYNRILCSNDFAADPSNNGLQVCGNEEKICKKIAFAVDVSLSSITMAAEQHANMLIVHHGLSWGGEPRRFCGSTGQRMAMLMKNELALYAMHLPLDAHTVYGNNAQLAELMQLQQRKMFFAYHGMNIGIIGQAAVPLSLETLGAMAGNGQSFRCFESPLREKMVRKVAVISGGGGLDGLEAAIAEQCDVLVTGEFDHTMYHVVQENKIHVIALGHYNSEVHGVKNLQKLAAEELNMETLFLDIPTGL